MKRRRSPRPDRSRLLSLLGVIALVVIAAIGYISYHALSGLPLSSSYRVAVDVPNANRLLETNDVRIAGVRVGQVDAVVARRDRPGGRPYARLTLALEASVGRLPVDTEVAVRPASILGATYVELRPGRSAATVADGGTLPRRDAAEPVELTDLFDIFDRSTARNVRRTMTEFGDGLAGRGTSLNVTFGAVSRLLPPLERVTRTLAAPETRLSPFFRSYESAMDAFAPVADQLAGITSGGAATFGALADERRALATTIEQLPETESATTEAFVRTRAPLHGLAGLAKDLRPAGRLLPRSLRVVNSTLAAGIPPMRALPDFNDALRDAFAALTALSRPSTTARSLLRITDLITQTDHVLDALAPAQIHCNRIALAGQNFSSFAGLLGSGEGPAMWNLVINTTGAETDGRQAKEPAPDLHLNYVPRENASECESNNEPEAPGRQAFGNPPGLQSSTTRDTDPPPGVLDRAREAGLLAAKRGGR